MSEADLQPYITPGTDSGHFRQLKSVHVHVDTTSPSQFPILKEYIREAEKMNLAGKINVVHQFGAGGQRNEPQWRRYYEAHTPGEKINGEVRESFSAFTTVRAYTRGQVIKLMQMAREMLPGSNSSVEAEQIIGIGDSQRGIFWAPSAFLWRPLKPEELGVQSLGQTARIEIHHGWNLPEELSAKIDFERLCEIEPSAVGGVFVSHRPGGVLAYRTNGFAEFQNDETDSLVLAIGRQVNSYSRHLQARGIDESHAKITTTVEGTLAVDKLAA